jgi:hypothetical protein
VGGLHQSGDIDDASTTGVDEVATLLHEGELLLAHHVLSLGKLGNVEGHEVGSLEELGESADLLRDTQGHQRHDVVVDDAHTHGLGQHRQLGANVAVSDYTEGLSTDLPALVADLVPGALVHLVGTVTELSRQHDDLSNDQLRHTARVTKRRVEDGDTVLGGIFEVDLVGADAEAADDNEVLSLAQHPLRKFRLGADSDGVNVTVVLPSALIDKRMRRSFAAAGILFLRGNHKFAQAESFSAAAKKKKHERNVAWDVMLQKRKRGTAYRIFSINSSSVREDLWNSTW